MEELLDKLNENFEVGIYQVLKNQMGKPLARVSICDKPYSIAEQENGLYEVAYASPDESSVDLPFMPKTLAMKLVSNLSADEVVGEITKNSAEYLQELITSPLFARHNIHS